MMGQREFRWHSLIPGVALAAAVGMTACTKEPADKGAAAASAQPAAPATVAGSKMRTWLIQTAAAAPCRGGVLKVLVRKRSWKKARSGAGLPGHRTRSPKDGLPRMLKSSLRRTVRALAERGGGSNPHCRS